LSYWASEAIGWAGGPVHRVWYEPDILDIFSACSLKIPRIYLNMLEYTQIFPYRAGVKVYREKWAGGRVGSPGGRRASEQPWRVPVVRKAKRTWLQTIKSMREAIAPLYIWQVTTPCIGVLQANSHAGGGKRSIMLQSRLY
jgi:hypothetical protein